MGLACGERHGHTAGILRLRETTEGCETLADYVRFLEKHMVGIERAEDGFVLHLGKTACTCPMAPEVAGPALCHCTCGREKAMWSAFFGRPVKTEIVESILRGGSDCVVRVRIPSAVGGE